MIGLESASTEGEQFEKEFSPTAYLDRYYPPLTDVLDFTEEVSTTGGPDRPINIAEIAHRYDEPQPEAIENICLIDWQRRVVKQLLQDFPNGVGTALEVGSGPTIFQHAITSLAAEQIIHLDFLHDNHKQARLDKNQIMKLENENPHWQTYFEAGREVLVRDKELLTLLRSREQAGGVAASRARRTLGSLNDMAGSGLHHQLAVTPIRHVMGDIFAENFTIPDAERTRTADTSLKQVTPESQFNFVSSHFVAESATHNPKRWEAGMLNLISTVKPGGYLSLAAIRNAEWYASGETPMPATPVDETNLRTFLVEHGFEMTDQQILVGSDKEVNGYDGMVFILARKPKSERTDPDNKPKRD